MKGDPCPADFLDDRLSGLAPDERLRVVIVLSDVVKNGGDQFRYAGECPATHAFVVEVAEKPLDDIEPRTAGRNEVDVEALVPFEPCDDLGVLVRGIVVSDEMEAEVGRRRAGTRQEWMEWRLMSWSRICGGYAE